MTTLFPTPTFQTPPRRRKHHRHVLPNCPSVDMIDLLRLAQVALEDQNQNNPQACPNRSKDVDPPRHHKTPTEPPRIIMNTKELISFADLKRNSTKSDASRTISVSPHSIACIGTSTIRCGCTTCKPANTNENVVLFPIHNFTNTQSPAAKAQKAQLSFRARKIRGYMRLNGKAPQKWLSFK
jgi:hypothetical protein